MSRIWFTSDLHLGHGHVASLRGFDSTLDHNTAVVKSLQDVVAKNDMLWVLGDIAWHHQALFHLNAVPGAKMAVLGNHDKLNAQVYLQLFRNVHGAVKYKNMWLTHIPIHPQEMYRCEANVHGHIHKNAATEPLPFPYINVNWDFWQRPVELPELQEMIMVARNDITGDAIKSKPATDAYRESPLWKNLEKQREHLRRSVREQLAPTDNQSTSVDDSEDTATTPAPEDS